MTTLDRWSPVRALDGSWRSRKNAALAIQSAIEQGRRDLARIQHFEQLYGDHPMATAMAVHRTYAVAS